MRRPTAEKPPACYHEAVARRNWTARLLALTGALTLNAAFFAFMPYLLRPAPSAPQFDQFIPQVSVVRIKRPETPLKKEIKTPDPAPEKPQAQNRPTPQTIRPRMTRLSLPFEINPRLPSGPDTLALPDMPPPQITAAEIDGAFSAGDLDAPLTVLSRIPPTYPLRAKHRGVEGWVNVRFLVKEDGTIDNVSVIENHPSDIFDQSVIRCVSGWRFKPGTVEGVAVKTWAETTIRFELR